MKDFAADLHIHTVLSPCADAAMRPPAIVEAALARGIGMIAICDHNATANIGAVREAAAGDLIVIAGIEITTVEEVHVLGWFGDDAAADAVAAVVRATLPARSGLRGALRAPEVVDALGAIVEHPDAAYESACALPLGHAVGLIRANGGIAVAAHADRRSFSVLSQLGIWPEGVEFDAIEVSAAGARHGRAADLQKPGKPVVTASDAHSLDEVGDARTIWALEAPDFAELLGALHGEGGRGWRIG